MCILIIFNCVQWAVWIVLSKKSCLICLPSHFIVGSYPLFTAHHLNLAQNTKLLMSSYYSHGVHHRGVQVPHKHTSFQSSPVR